MQQLGPAQHGGIGPATGIGLQLQQQSGAQGFNAHQARAGFAQRGRVCIARALNASGQVRQGLHQRHAGLRRYAKVQVAHRVLQAFECACVQDRLVRQCQQGGAQCQQVA
jgi:hypothetical protein